MCPHFLTEIPYDILLISCIGRGDRPAGMSVFAQDSFALPGPEQIPTPVQRKSRIETRFVALLELLPLQ